MKILIAEFTHETNTFSINRTTFETFSPTGWVEASQVIPTFRGTPDYLGGMIRAAGEMGVELLPVKSINGGAGPLITRECLDYIVDGICGEIKMHLGEFDGICLALHGAGCAEGVDDIETYMLKAVRAIVGDEIPITTSHDLHGNITPERINLCNGIFAIKENPHIDQQQAGYFAMKYLVLRLRGESDPVTTLVRLPVLLVPALTNTFGEPMKSVKEHFAARCAEKGMLDATFFHGFAGSDHPYSNASVVIVSERRNSEKAAALAKELASYYWSRRQEFVPVTLSPAQAIDKALTLVKDGYGVINELSDNPGSGCPGDGTHLLREMIERDIPGAIFGYIFDPETAKQAHEAGVGARISVRVGAKTDIMSGEPIELDDVEVCNLSDGKFVYVSPMRRGIPFDLGLTARLRHGNVEFVVASFRAQTLDDRPFFITGADITQYKILALKSANHFRGFFQERADAIVTADPPGLRTCNLKLFPFARVQRPIFPLEDNAPFANDTVFQSTR